MVKFFRDFYCEEEGMGTVEIVIIIAVLVAVALIFKNTITDFATILMENVFNTTNAEDATSSNTGSLMNGAGE